MRLVECQPESRRRPRLGARWLHRWVSTLSEVSMAKVKDPVCDMEIESHEAVGTYEFEGTTYYFCAPNCLDAFVANPSRYVGSTALTDREVPLEKHEPRFTKEG